MFYRGYKQENNSIVGGFILSFMRSQCNSGCLFGCLKGITFNKTPLLKSKTLSFLSISESYQKSLSKKAKAITLQPTNWMGPIGSSIF